jgi:uncharacterized protein (TIGR02246 family)
MVSEAAASQVRAVELAYDRAWGAGDLAGVLDCLAEDVVLVSPRGDVARGRVEAERLLGGFLRGEALGSVHSSEIVRVEFVGDDVAVLDGVATIADGESSGGVVLKHGFTDVLVRRAGRWLIAHVRAYGLVGG